MRLPYACRRGWRRSGRWVYFPLQDRSCCQLLTIRLDASRFQANKDQVGKGSVVTAVLSLLRGRPDGGIELGSAAGRGWVWEQAGPAAALP